MGGTFEESVEFRMREVFDEPGAVRLILDGELDLAVAEILGERLRILRDAGYSVRLDLGELDFIDSSGLLELIAALSAARADGWRLEIDPQLTATVRRTVEISGLRARLWPDDG
jgi:anti-anti-sigma factor